jgi:outer membrane protein assembly factor BamB
LPTRARLHIKAGAHLYAGIPGAVQAIRIPDSGGPAEIVWQGEIVGVPEQVVAADSRLFVATREGRIYCFGAQRPDATGLPGARVVRPTSESTDKCSEAAKGILRSSGVRQGYAVVLGLDNGRLVEELIHQSDLTIIAVEPDAAKVDRLRRRLNDAGLYGVRASVHIGDPATYPLPPLLADLVVSERMVTDGSVLRAAVRLLRPYGGTACLSLDTAGTLANALDKEQDPGLGIENRADWTLIRREGELPGSADWSHIAADAANSGSTDDRFLSAPLELLWFDGALRWHRKTGSAEVRVADGRILVKADKLYAIDVYTGRVVWQTDLPLRHNPTDQIVALDDRIYVTSGHACLVLDAATGEIARRMGLPDGIAAPWKNLRVVDKAIIGQGGNAVFCLDRDSGKPRWRHTCSRSALSVAVGGGRVYCAELINARRGEKESEQTKTRALDIVTGKALWEIVRGVKLVYSGAHDLLVTSRGIYRGADGTLVMETTGFDQTHGNQACDVLSVVDDQVLWGTVTSFTSYDLKSGDPAGSLTAWVRRGCTGLRASTHLVTTRYRGNCAYIQLDSREITPLWNIRPACNNNLYPANGILNIPCLTGGCECNYTPASQAYVPRAILEK